MGDLSRMRRQLYRDIKRYCDYEKNAFTENSKDVWKKLKLESAAPYIGRRKEGIIKRILNKIKSFIGG